MAGQVIYVDITFLNNLVADIVLLWLTSVVSGLPARAWRIMLSALAGAGYAVCCLVFSDGVIFSPILGLFFPALMVLVTFHPLTWNSFVRCYGFLLGLSFLAGGSILALAGLGIVPATYRSLPLGLILVIAAGMLGYRWLTQKSLANRLYREIEIKFGEECVTGRALVDTGNLLTDPLTGQPVIIVELDWVRSCIPEPIQELADKGHLSRESMEAVDECAAGMGIRIIPFHSVGQSDGTLLAVKSERVTVKGSKGEVVRHGALVALARGHLSQDNSFQAIVPASMG